MSKIRSIKVLYFKIANGQVAELEGDNIHKEFRKALKDQGVKIKPEEIESLWKSVRAGAEECPGVDEMESEVAKPYKQAFAFLEKALQFHDKESQRLEAQAEKEEAARIKRGEVLMLSAQKGYALAEAAAEDLVVGGLQALAGKKVIVSELGATFKEGEQLSEKEFVEIIASISNLTARFDSAKQSAVFVLGDICVEAMKYQNGEEVISNAVRLTGKDKHTVQQAINMCQWCPQDKRTPGLFGTHYIEAMQFRKGSKSEYQLTDTKLFKLLGDAAQGEKIIDATAANGEKKEKYAPLSTLKFREMLNKAAGKPEKTKLEPSGPVSAVPTPEEDSDAPTAAPVRSAGYLYVFVDESGLAIARQHELLSEKANEEASLVVDLVTMWGVGRGGEELDAVDQLEDSYFPEKETKSKKSKKKSTPVTEVEAPA